jgi:hypothetical protein
MLLGTLLDTLLPRGNNWGIRGFDDTTKFDGR